MDSERRSYRTAILYSMGSISAGLFYAFNNFVLPLYLSFFTQDAILIGWLSSTRSIEQSVIQPVVGAASDRTWTRLGRRAPFFVLTMPIVAILFVLAAHIPHGPESLLPVVAIIFVFSLLFNIGIDPYTALFADITPPERRGRVSSIAAVFGFAGQIAILLAGVLLWTSQPTLVFYMLAAGIVVGFGITAFGVRESRDLVERTERGPWRNYVKSVLTHREAMKYLFVQFLYGFGVNAAMPFLTLFVVKEIGVGEDTALLMAAILLITTAVFSIPAGWLGDRLGLKRVYAGGLILMGIFALLTTMVHSIPELLIMLLMLGIGNAAGSVLWYPILTELVPAGRIGEFTGIATIFQTGAIAFSVMAAGELINLNVFGMGYRSIFILTGSFILLSVALLSFVRVPKAAQINAVPADLKAAPTNAV